MNEDFLNRKLHQRLESYSYRELRREGPAVDFCSNDYLGIVARNLLVNNPGALPQKWSGSTGSRLISGNYALIEETESMIAQFHKAPAALIFNSGYDANIGILGSIPQRTDTVVYDELSHASIRDGIRLSHAASFSFNHNDVEDLEKKLQAAKGNVFVVTESIFSMDGDIAPLQEISELCASYNAYLIVDEAHATGIAGNNGEGVVQSLGLQNKCLARVHTFGKALGCHGAVIVGSNVLIKYLINFCRPFIYTTGMPASAVYAINASYSIFPGMHHERTVLNDLVKLFRENKDDLRLCNSVTPIQGVIIPGNEKVKLAAQTMMENGFNVRPIMYPTVPKGQERLRIVLHTFNTSQQVNSLLTILKELH